MQLEIMEIAMFIIWLDDGFKGLLGGVRKYNRERLCAEEVKIRGLDYCAKLNSSEIKKIDHGLIQEITRRRKFRSQCDLNIEDSRGDYSKSTEQTPPELMGSRCCRKRCISFNLI